MCNKIRWKREKFIKKNANHNLGCGVTISHFLQNELVTHISINTQFISFKQRLGVLSRLDLGKS